MNSLEITEVIQSKIQNLTILQELKERGIITSIKDGILTIVGLQNVMQGEMIEIFHDRFALALNLEEDIVKAAVIGDYSDLAVGLEVSRTKKVFEVPVGEMLLGRVVDTRGIPIDDQGPLNASITKPIEVIAPGVIERKSVYKPLQTGYKLVDAMIPIGRGQRELIIGDRQTGKTTLAIDTIINQRNTGVKCIYVAIGQKESSIAAIVQKLKENNALDYTIVVAAPAAASPVLQYLAPYTGCTMGEYFRDLGEDALIIYDDLTKQANAYRQISLLIRRPPGREAFPGDIFYLHSRLLERACSVNENYIAQATNNAVLGKTGSLTALPIIETQAGDVSAFIPTNVISITDGQIFLETNLFNKGMRPAVNPGISVSRVGGAAQTKVIKKLSGGMRIGLAQYRELESFAQFASDLDKTSRLQLFRGQKITELLKQDINNPLDVFSQALVLFAIEYNYLDKIEVHHIASFEKHLFTFARDKYAAAQEMINSTGNYDEDIKNIFQDILDSFLKIGSW